MNSQLFFAFLFNHIGEASEWYSKNGHRSRRQLDYSYGSPAYKHCVCGKQNAALPGGTRTLGGTEVFENQYPWMALIIGNGSRLVGGGSIINDRYVLTAAHCLLLGFRQYEMKIVLGEHDRCKPDSRTVIFSVEKLIPHPRFNKDTNHADIMLVRLNMKVTFNEFIRPICLPGINLKASSAMKLGGKQSWVLGWGQTDTATEVCALNIVALEVYKPQNCYTKIATLLCAGIPTGGRDSCQGDSGGPLQVQNEKNRFELIGIVSNGIGCGEKGFPGLYTDVARMIPWIMEVTSQDAMYCWR